MWYIRSDECYSDAARLPNYRSITQLISFFSRYICIHTHLPKNISRDALGSPLLMYSRFHAARPTERFARIYLTLGDLRRENSGG